MTGFRVMVVSGVVTELKTLWVSTSQHSTSTVSTSLNHTAMEFDVEELIDEVQKRRGLYDTTTKEYSDKNEKRKLWEEVCIELLPNWDRLDPQEKIKQGKEIQKRWSSLRDCFRRELAQQKKISSGSAAKKRRTYIYFDDLLFLLPFTQIPQTSSLLDNEEGIPTQDYNADELQLEQTAWPSESEPSAIPHKKKRTQKNYDEPFLLPFSQIPQTSSSLDNEEGIPTQDYNADESQLEQTARPSESEPSAISHKKKRTQKNYDEEILQVLKEGIKKNQLDEDDSFLMSLSPAFKKYDEETKYLLRIEFMNTIIRFDRNHKQHVIPRT